MLKHVRSLRRDMTDAERRLWSRLRRRQMAGFKFRRQHQIGLYICDFASVEAGVAIELDGSQHVEQAVYDSRWDAFIRGAGFRVLPFWNADVLARTDQIIETIYEALHRPELDGRFD